MPAQLDKHREAKRFELEIAAALSARRIFLSGAGMEKADVRKKARYTVEDGMPQRTAALAFRVEAKTTARTSYSFKVTDWHDLIRVADAAGEMPVFAVQFLRTPFATAVVRRPFAIELGLVSMSALTPTPVGRSVSLGPGVHCVLDVPRPTAGVTLRRELLTVVPYSSFIESVKRHALFEPT